MPHTVVDSQQEVIGFLSRPAAYGQSAGVVERIDTHISVVFLFGRRAYKLKRALRFDYLDFSTAALRRQACAAEVRVNRRTARGLYRGILAVTRAPDGGLALGGSGRPIDWVVEMVRFDQETLLDRLAERGRLDEPLMRTLAGAIARFHQEAETRADHGGSAGMSWVVRGNSAGLAEEGATLFDPTQRETMDARMQEELARQATLLDARRWHGFVRHCHGDLHLRNICLLDGEPTLFDAIEFNDEIACTDVLYDLAFLLMDLLHRGLRPLANVVLNHYLDLTRDLGGLGLLPLFPSCRATVRAKIGATASALQPDPAQAAALRDEAVAYLGMALELLGPAPPRVVAVGGPSGSGKSVLAAGLAPGLGAAPGAVVLRSDVVRKSLYDVPPTERLPPDAYRPVVSAIVYRTLAERMTLLVRAGRSVVVDAVFTDPSDRAALEATVGDAVPFTGLWLEAPADVLADRVARRTGDPSDADVEVLRRQLAQPAGDISWTRVDASGDPGSVLRRAERALASA